MQVPTQTDVLRRLPSQRPDQTLTARLTVAWDLPARQTGGPTSIVLHPGAALVGSSSRTGAASVSPASPSLGPFPQGLGSCLLLPDLPDVADLPSHPSQPPLLFPQTSPNSHTPPASFSPSNLKCPCPLKGNSQPSSSLWGDRP